MKAIVVSGSSTWAHVLRYLWDTDGVYFGKAGTYKKKLVYILHNACLINVHNYLSTSGFMDTTEKPNRKIRGHPFAYE